MPQDTVAIMTVVALFALALLLLIQWCSAFVMQPTLHLHGLSVSCQSTPPAQMLLASELSLRGLVVLILYEFASYCYAAIVRRSLVRFCMLLCCMLSLGPTCACWRFQLQSSLST
jgi:hypothetical protein